MITEVLKNSILIEAFKGNLTERNKDDSSVDELLKTIEEEKQAIIVEKKIDKISQTISDKEIPFCIPQNWRWVRWGNLSYSIQYGVNAGAKNQGKIKMVRISDIQDNSIIWENVPYCDISDNLLSKYVLNENDILFARTGGTVGKSVIVSDMPKDVPYVFAGYLIRSNYNERINCKFLKFFMESPLYWKQLRDETIGSAQPNCNGQKLSNMILPFPPIEEQQRIVDKIEELFAKLDEIKPIEEELQILKSKFPEDMKRAILLSAIMGKLSSQKKDENISLKVDKIHNITYPFNIPRNWSWYSHNDLFEIVGGSQPPKSRFSTQKKDGYIRLYQIRDYGTNPQPIYVNKDDVTIFSDSGDIIVARYGGSLGKVFWAEAGAYNVALAKVIIKYPQIINKTYLYYYYLADLYQSKVKTGNRSAQAGFSKDDLNDLPFPLPPIEEQQRIVDKLELLLPLCDEIENLVKENYNG